MGFLAVVPKFLAVVSLNVFHANFPAAAALTKASIFASTRGDFLAGF